MKRTHTCGELTDKDVKKEATLQGWCGTRRDHGGLIFIDLRDRYGITQIVLDPKSPGFEQAEHLRREDVIQVSGKVRERPKGMENLNLKTGKIEVFCTDLEILNKAETPPLEIDDRKIANEEVRLNYRYLDLRRPEMQRRLKLRHTAAQAARKYLSENNFIEIETPLLVRATPEGARDYIVPSRVHPGKFYALPQSPQLYKQILMVSGFDRYFQLARCLRDEDLRADRQPEHTQIDIEMSFPELEDLYTLVEGLMKALWKAAISYDIKTPFVRMPYKEAMEKYGIDKPDIRYELFLHDVTDIAKDSDFTVFKDTIKNSGIVKCIVCPADLARKEIDRYIEFCQQLGAKGMAWMKVTDKGLDSNIVKFFSDDIQKKLIKKTGAKVGNIIMFIADKPKLTNQILSRLREDLAAKLKLYNQDEFKFCWITEFPLFEWNDEEEKIEPAHHMFCMPLVNDLKYLETDPLRVHCTQYDLVLNGVEIGSGSIRINNPDVQERVMKVIGLSKKDAENKFGFLLNAFKYGAPPHGGIGIGFDRVVALLCGTNDIREVIAFPKNKAAECPMDGSPSDVEEKQLKELHIKKEAAKK